MAEGWHVEDFAGVLADWGMLELPPRRRADSTRPVEASTEASTSRTESGEDVKAVVRRWYEALQRRDTTALAELLDPGYLNHGPHGPGLPITPGPDGATHDVLTLHTAFPDVDVTVADVFAEGNQAAARVIVRGTHLGPPPGIPATAKRTAVMGNEIWRVIGHRIVQHWGWFEDLDLLQQLDAIPAAPP